jgi:hypothetical protein
MRGAKEEIDALNRAIAQADEEYAGKQNENGALEKVIADLQTQKKEIEDEIRRNRAHRRQLERAIVLARQQSPEMADIFVEIYALGRELANDEITIRRSSEIGKRIRELRDSMPSICDHRLVLHVDERRCDEPYTEFTDPAERRCAICGMKERGTVGSPLPHECMRNYRFTRLADSSERVVLLATESEFRFYDSPKSLEEVYARFTSPNVIFRD